jgi:hypothetical protein
VFLDRPEKIDIDSIKIDLPASTYSEPAAPDASSMGGASSADEEARRNAELFNNSGSNPAQKP